MNTVHFYRSRAVFPGSLRHESCEHLPRHSHDRVFATLVLSGAYVEAGDTGYHTLRQGDVLYHRAFESHLDRIGRSGADVLVLDADRAALPLFGSVADPDAIAKVAIHDRDEAMAILADAVTERTVPIPDWPAGLAAALQADPSLDLRVWAEAAGLHAGSVARGFRQMFSLNPLEYRLIQRTQRAVRAIAEGTDTLSAIASEQGFADQAHMTRAVGRITGLSPAALRRRSLAISASASGGH